MNQRKTYALILVGASIWCGGIILPPLLHYWSGETIIETLILKFYSHICHQNSARSCTFFGAPFAVCIRCSSVYFSFLCGVLLWNIFSRNATFEKYFSALFSFPSVFIFALPMLADVVARFIGLYNDEFSFYASRIVTGGLFGFSFAFALLPVFFSACEELFPTKFLLKK